MCVCVCEREKSELLSLLGESEEEWRMRCAMVCAHGGILRPSHSQPRPLNVADALRSGGPVDGCGGGGLECG